MSYYRYSFSYPEKGEKGEKAEKDGSVTFRSPSPISLENEKSPHFVHRYYTSEKDDSPFYYIVSIGHEKSWPSKAILSRTIERFILHYVVAGKGTFQGKPVHAGQFFFSHPYETHSICADPEDPMEFYYISVAGPGLQELILMTGFYSVPSICDYHFEDQIAPAFHDALYKTHPQNDPELYLLSLFHRLMSFHRMENTGTSADSTKMNAFQYYKAALTFIQEFLTDGITPRDVAEHLHISPSYLRLIFSRFCKYSVRELLVRKRIECAASRLTFDGDSVQQAAAFAGYSDYTLFSKIFKKYTGISPYAYKKQDSHPDLLRDLPTPEKPT